MTEETDTPHLFWAKLQSECASLEHHGTHCIQVTNPFGQSQVTVNVMISECSELTCMKLTLRFYMQQKIYFFFGR